MLCRKGLRRMNEASQGVAHSRGSAASRRSASVATLALVAGIGWLLLIPAAELERRDVLSYDGYNRLLALPLLLFAVTLLCVPHVLPGEAKRAQLGFRIAAVGAAVLFVGNVVEFYGVLLQSELNAMAAHEVGDASHWIGSDIGWLIFGVGMLTLLIGGVTGAIGVGGWGTRPRWLVLFMATLGIGVLAGNLFGLAPAFVSVPALAAYSVGWIYFAAVLEGRAKRLRLH